MNYFSFVEFERIYKVIDKDFLIWFIGFSEGDGSWIVRTEKKRILFQIGQKEKQILFYIRDTFGFGIVRSYDTKTRLNKFNQIYYQYVVEKKQHILFLIALFNGNICLNKTQNRFYKWVNNYQLFYGHKTNFKIKKVKVNLNSPWLCGFTDAEGCFYARLTKPTLKRKVEIQRGFSLSQSEKEILIFIRELVLQEIRIKAKSPTYLITTNNTYKIPNFRLNISNREQLLIVIDYFTRYGLKTKKRISFERWVYFVTEKNLINRYTSQNALFKLKTLILAVQNHNLIFEPLNLP